MSTPGDLARLAVLRDALQIEMARRDANPDASRPDAFGASTPPDGWTHPGTVRPRDDNSSDESSPQVMDHLAPYSMEEGRAFKRHKNLSAASEADADMFLNVRVFYLLELLAAENEYQTSNPMRHNFQGFVAILQCRDMLQIIKADGDKKYKLPDTVTVTPHYISQSPLVILTSVLRKHLRTMPNARCCPPTLKIIATPRMVQLFLRSSW